MRLLQLAMLATFVTLLSCANANSSRLSTKLVSANPARVLTAQGNVNDKKRLRGNENEVSTGDLAVQEEQGIKLLPFRLIFPVIKRTKYYNELVLGTFKKLQRMGETPTTLEAKFHKGEDNLFLEEYTQWFNSAKKAGLIR